MPKFLWLARTKVLHKIGDNREECIAELSGNLQSYLLDGNLRTWIRWVCWKFVWILGWLLQKECMFYQSTYPCSCHNTSWFLGRIFKTGKKYIECLIRVSESAWCFQQEYCHCFIKLRPPFAVGFNVTCFNHFERKCTFRTWYNNLTILSTWLRVNLIIPNFLSHGKNGWPLTE